MTALLALVASPVARWIGGAVVVLAIVGSAYLFVSHRAYNRGWDRALADVKAQDATAKQAAAAAQAPVDACYAREGWTWSVFTGSCQRDAP